MKKILLLSSFLLLAGCEEIELKVMNDAKIVNLDKACGGCHTIAEIEKNGTSYKFTVSGDIIHIISENNTYDIKYDKDYWVQDIILPE